MFKKITIIIIVFSVILLMPEISAGRGMGGFGGGGGGRGGMGGGRNMGGGGFTDQQNMGGGRTGGRNNFTPTTIDPNLFRTSTILTYLRDANDVKIDPNSLSNEVLQNLLIQIAQGDQGTVLDTAIFEPLRNTGNTYAGRVNTNVNPNSFYDPNDPDPNVALTINTLGINDIIRFLVDWTHKTIIPSPEAYNLTITIYSPEYVKRSQALNIIYTAMMIQGNCVVEETDDFIYIKPGNIIQTVDAPILNENQKLSDYVDENNIDKIVKKIFRLQHYSPTAMGQLILPFLNSTGHVTADESTGTLMVMDRLRMLTRIELLINQFDVDLADTVTELLPVKYRDPQEMVELLQTILASTGLISSSGGFGSMSNYMGNQMQMPTLSVSTTSSSRDSRNSRTTTDRGRTSSTNSNQRGRGNNTMMGMAGSGSAAAMQIGTSRIEPMLIAEPRNNCIIARATARDMIEIKKWLDELDTEAVVLWDPDSNELGTMSPSQVVQKFYYLQYNSAERIAQIIENLLTESGYLIAEESTGTISIIDTAESVMRVEEVIKRFDVPMSDDTQEQIFTVRHGDPYEIVQLINLLLDSEVSGSTRTTGMTGGRTTGRTTGGRTTR